IAFEPKTDGRAMSAVSAHGTIESIPNLAAPFVLSAVSKRCVRRPMIVKLLGSLRGTSAGIGIEAADSARAPYESRRLLDSCVTWPRCVVHAFAGTSHFFAAAAMSIALAVAPALRSRSHSDVTLLLPPVI